MTSTKDRTARWHRYWDKKSRNYDKEMKFFDRHLFGDSRSWACGQATGEVLEVAVGTGLNLEAYPRDITLTGIDWSDAMLDIARRRATESGAPRPCSRPTPTSCRSTTPRSTPSFARSGFARSPTTPRPSPR